MKIPDLLNPEIDTNDKNLNEHPSTSHEDLNYSFACYKCGTTFKKKNEYVRHIKTLHPTSDTIWYVCPNPGCDKKFTRQDALRSHLRSKKAQEFKCQPLNYFYRYESPFLSANTHPEDDSNNSNAKDQM
jgi:uncharacterized Zn-finger protein